MLSVKSWQIYVFSFILFYWYGQNKYSKSFQGTCTKGHVFFINFIFLFKKREDIECRKTNFIFSRPCPASVCPRSGKNVHHPHLPYRKKIRACLLVTDIIKMGADVTAIDFRSNDSFLFFFLCIIYPVLLFYRVALA